LYESSQLCAEEEAEKSNKKTVMKTLKREAMKTNQKLGTNEDI